jgi:hypothetical protein
MQPAVASLVWSGHRKAVFLANNHLIQPAHLARLAVLPADILVQFNQAPFFDHYAGLACHKAHVFNANAEGSYWGFSVDGAPARDYCGQRAAGISLLFMRWLSAPAKAFISALPPHAQALVIQEDWRPLEHCYPPGKLPSAGFAAVVFFRRINTLRRCCGQPALTLVLAGFSGHYLPGKGWSGHDYAYEQTVYDTWLDLERWDHEGPGDKS